MKKKENYNYFEEFIKMSNNIVESAQILNETLEEYNLKEAQDNSLRVHNLENNTDDIVHNIKNYLIKDFLPPIDREDINEIGNELDNIQDEIDEILINFDILNITLIRINTYEFGKLLLECCLIVKEAMNELKKFKKANTIKEKIIQLNKLEEDGDRLYEKSMKELYMTESNPIEIMKWTTIFNHFEDAVDACEHLANVLEDTLLQNA